MRRDHLRPSRGLDTSGSWSRHARCSTQVVARLDHRGSDTLVSLVEPERSEGMSRPREGGREETTEEHDSRSSGTCKVG